MSDILLVPIKLDALVLAQPTQVVAPLADFSSLPYVDPKSEGRPRDVNSDTAFLSSNVLSEPFEDDRLLLQAGVHLHWALPDALTIGRHPYKRNSNGELIRNKDGQLIPDTDHVEYPVVPNRWLVLRQGGGLKDKSWVVESDYLWPEGTEWEEGRITYLIPPESRGPHKQPYRYLGRTQLVKEWHAPEKGGYLEELKVYGYGEPNFAAFYPSCQGVFGLHDEEVTAEHDDVSYRVLGWIGGPKASSKDILQLLSVQLKAEALVAKLADEFKWTLPDCYSTAELKPTGAAGTIVPTGSLFQDDGQSSWRSTVDATLPDTIQVQAVDIGAVATAGAISTIVTPIAGLISVTNPSAASPGLPVPQRIMCYAELKNVTAAGTRLPQKPHVEIAVGNTGTEALSAWLANTLDAGDPSGKIENQLEALHLEDGLRELDLDLGPRFHEARHDASFHAVSGGTRWTLHAGGKEPAESASAAKQPVDLAALPFEIATLLHELNDVRAAWDRAQADIVSARRQIFIEWHKYATCCHHPDFPQDDYPDIDDLEAHIDRMIAMLKLRCFYAGLSSDPPGLHLEALSLDHLRQLTTPDESAFRSWFHAMKVGDVCPPPLADLFADKKAALEAELADLFADKKAALEAELADLFADKKAALEAELAKLSDVEITLREAAAPRYWRPNDPVLLLAGEGVQTTNRHGEDGVLSCLVVSDGDLDLDALETSSDVNIALGTVLSKAEEGHTDGAPWARQTYEAPWHPLFIEWEVSLQPTRGGNVSSTGREYPAGFIEDSFELTETRCELRPKPKDGNTEDTVVGTSFMTGRSILVPHARLILERRIEDYLVLHLIELLRQQAKPDAKPPLDDKAKSLLEPGTPREKLLDWLHENEPQVLKWSDAVHQPNKSPMHTVLDAREKLDDWENEGKAFQSQALGGLNEALLMRHDVLQLEPVEPQGFTESNDFVERVKEAVDMKHYTHHAPLPHFDFHPIRSGLLRLEKLRLVDTFGRHVDLMESAGSLVRAEQMEVPHDTAVALPPRFTQPARLNFRFLSANEDWLQTNSHPLTTPVCGWIAANNLDRSVMIYDGSGAMLGYVDFTGRWRTPPGRPGPILPNDIANDHLARMVTWLCTQARLSREETQAPTEPSPFIDAFIDAIDSALENIDPEGFAQHQARALLMSRPLALVRAAVSLEVQGQPAFDQSWDAFGGVMRGGAYDTAGFLDVDVPIRIGEHLQLNDGVAAYWLDTDEGFAKDRLYLPQSEERVPVPKGAKPTVTDNFFYTDDSGDSFAGRPLTFPLRLSDAPQLVSMLLDPRGTAHATCGLLPTKVLRIPPEHFSKALEAINVTFLSSPLLTPSGRMELTLPSEPGWHWSWVHREDGSWQEWTTTPVVERSAFRAAFSEKSREVWQELLDQNWITEINYERARVNATKERNTPPVLTVPDIESEDIETKERNTPPVLTVPDIESEDIERVLDIATRVLQPAPLQARFNRTEIREGWLQLTRDPTQRNLP